MITPKRAPDITEGIPAIIAARTLGATYANNGLKYDVAFAGLPFILAPHTSSVYTRNPYTRTTADPNKQQIDVSREAGEQTLDQWWNRSQDSWHNGCGIKFYEPGSDPLTANRFAASLGVDVWTKGQVTLLKKMTLAQTSASYCFTTTAVVSGFDNYFVNANGAVTRESGTASVAYTGTVATRIALAGDLILGGTTTGISQGPASGTALASLWTIAAGNVVVPYWAKNRIIATRDNNLYELTLVGGAIGTALYTHPAAGWTWTSVAEGPTAILASGFVNGASAIYSFTLTTDGGAGAVVPKLGQPFQVAEFPPGEEVHSLRVYLGTYVAIGTSRGLRIGQIENNGGISYGPLLIETTKPVRALSARDKFVYAGIEAGLDGSSGCARVDLSTPIDDLVFPWAYDANTKDIGTIQSLSFLGNTGRVVLAVNGKGAYLQSATAFEPTGYVTSGKIRYATSELKDFRRARVSGSAASGGSIALFVQNAGGAETFLYALSSLSGFNEDIQLSMAGPQSNAAIRLELRAPLDGLSTPTLDAFGVKALPSLRRQRIIRYPVLCSDNESDRFNNQRKVFDGAAKRLAAIEELENTSAVVLVKDFTNGESYEGQIENIEFIRTSPADKSSKGFGGIATITVRKL